MTARGWNRRKRLYLIWTVISVVVLYLMVQLRLEKYIILIVVILFLKDIFIDLGGFGFFGKKLPKRGPTPPWLEHAPFVALVALGGFTGMLNVSQLTIWLAALDTVIDVLDDMGWI